MRGQKFAAMLCFVMLSSVQAFAEDLGLSLQHPEDGLSGHPRDSEGRVDWMKALQDGKVSPRATISGAPRGQDPMGVAPKEPALFKYTAQMPFVSFPHLSHTEWLSCSNCHDEIFSRQKIGRFEGMSRIVAGERCGVCHGSVAFQPEGNCYRCHSVDNPNGVIKVPQNLNVRLSDSADGAPIDLPPSLGKKRRPPPVQR